MTQVLDGLTDPWTALAAVVIGLVFYAVGMLAVLWIILRAGAAQEALDGATPETTHDLALRDARTQLRADLRRRQAGAPLPAVLARDAGMGRDGSLIGVDQHGAARRARLGESQATRREDVRPFGVDVDAAQDATAHAAREWA